VADAGEAGEASRRLSLRLFHEPNMPARARETLYSARSLRWPSRLVRRWRALTDATKSKRFAVPRQYNLGPGPILSRPLLSPLPRPGLGQKARALISSSSFLVLNTRRHFFHTSLLPLEPEVIRSRESLANESAILASYEVSRGRELCQEGSLQK